MKLNAKIGFLCVNAWLYRYDRCHEFTLLSQTTPAPNPLHYEATQPPTPKSVA